MLKIQHKNFNKDWFQHKCFLLCVHSEDLSSGNILLPHSAHSTLIAFRIFTKAHMPQSASDSRGSTFVKKKKGELLQKKDCRAGGALHSSGYVAFKNNHTLVTW